MYQGNAAYELLNSYGKNTILSTSFIIAALFFILISTYPKLLSSDMRTHREFLQRTHGMVIPITLLLIIFAINGLGIR